MNPFKSLSEVFDTFFLAGAGWAAAGLLKELVISVINQVVGAIIMRKQMAQMRRMQEAAQQRGYAGLAGATAQYNPEEQ